MIHKCSGHGFTVRELDYSEILVQLHYIDPVADIAAFLHLDP
jgi:hypothetical protein